MGNKDKKKNDKPKTERKPRKERAKMRSKKESFAGHFADRLAANEKQRADIMKAIAVIPGATDDVLSVAGRVEFLNIAAASGFVPERKKGGNRGPQFKPGQEIELHPEAIAMLETNIPKVKTAKLFVSTSYNPGGKEKTVPVWADAPLTGTWVGYVSKKWVADATPVAA
jgi:hypothetical protein